MGKFSNAYYVVHDFADNPFFLGPYGTLESAERGYDNCKGEEDLQIIRVQVVK